MRAIENNDIQSCNEKTVLAKKEIIVKRSDYAFKVGKLTRRYNIPFDIGLILGDKEEIYSLFKSKIRNLDRVSIGTVRDLQAGAKRYKNGLRQVLGQELCDVLYIDYIKRQKSQRIARFVAAMCLMRLYN